MFYDFLVKIDQKFYNLAGEFKISTFSCSCQFTQYLNLMIVIYNETEALNGRRIN